MIIKMWISFYVFILFLSIASIRVNSRIHSPMDAKALKDALKSAKSGDFIRIERSGAYVGGFAVNTSGKARHAITLTGAPGALITCKAKQGIGIYFKNRKYWNISGITIADCENGLVLEGSSSIIMNSINITNISEYGIHLKNQSSKNVITNCRIRETNKDLTKHSQVIAIGTDYRYWIDNSPDTSNYNEIANNSIDSSNGALIEVKEGTCCNTIKDNLLNGSAMQRPNDPWINIKGDSNRIIRNMGSVGQKYGYVVQTNRRVNLGGCANVITENKCDLKTKAICLDVRNKDLCSNNVYNNSDSNKSRLSDKT